MAVIRCKGKLWERLGGRRATQTGHQAAIPGVLLGSWAAKVFKCESRHLVVAVNERTYLTVVFPLGPSERFAAELATAAATALRDLGVPEAIVRAESAAMEFMPIARLGSDEGVETLDRVQYFCELELYYIDDLRIVQRNLNDLPHPNRDPCVPFEAVRALFQNVGEGVSWLRSIA